MSIEAANLTSVGTTSAEPPQATHSTATFCSGPSSRAARTSRAPFRANANAVARPLPLAAPVITPTAPVTARSVRTNRIRPPRATAKRAARPQTQQGERHGPAPGPYEVGDRQTSPRHAQEPL